MVTGGTGFIGRWLLEALRFADERLRLDCEVVLLSRDPQAFATRAHRLAAWPALRVVAGDVTSPAPALGGEFTHIVHAATDASADLNTRDPLRMFDTIVTGTRRVLDLARAHSNCRMLYLSSGAVYGVQPWDITHVAEDWRGGPDCSDPHASYAEGKRAAEMLCAIHAAQFGVQCMTARIFAVLGPLLPLRKHFAAGNFIGDAIEGHTITVEGAGTAVRSYLYTTDLVIWLWRMLLCAASGATYNVGSPEAVSIADLARRTSAVLGAPGYQVLGKSDAGWNAQRYVPCVAAIERDLGLKPTVDLDDAIRRTAIANGWRG